eukprot:1191099-Prorocentrum_minimum.AAC.14
MPPNHRRIRFSPQMFADTTCPCRARVPTPQRPLECPPPALPPLSTPAVHSLCPPAPPNPPLALDTDTWQLNSRVTRRLNEVFSVDSTASVSRTARVSRAGRGDALRDESGVAGPRGQEFPGGVERAHLPAGDKEVLPMGGQHPLAAGVPRPRLAPMGGAPAGGPRSRAAGAGAAAAAGARGPAHALARVAVPRGGRL